MTCVVDACARPVKARGWCGTHYQRWWKTGDPESTPTTGAPLHMRQGSARHRIHELLEIDGGWMTFHMVAAEFAMRWPATNERSIHRAYHRLANTEWVTTRQVEGSVRTGWNGVSIVNELKAL